MTPRNGWQTTSADELKRIAEQYNPRRTIAGMPAITPTSAYTPPVATRLTLGGMPSFALGAAGPTGDSGPMLAEPPSFVAPPVAPVAEATQPPAQNAIQRWTEPKDDTKPRELSQARRYFWATNRIDARAPQADLSQHKGMARTDFDATFGANRQHMGSAGTTWAQRQASNAAGINDAVERRKLPDDWQSAY